MAQLAPQPDAPARAGEVNCSLVSRNSRGPLAKWHTQINQQKGQVRGTDAADTARLTQICRTNPRKLFLGFGAQLRYSPIVEMFRDRPRFQSLEPLHLSGLPIDIPGILGFQYDLLDRALLSSPSLQCRFHFAELLPVHVRPAQQLFQR